MFEMPGGAGPMGRHGGNGRHKPRRSVRRRVPGRKKRRKMSVAASHRILLTEEADKLLDQEQVTRAALDSVEQDGIVFLDEIDKVCAKAETRGADVSREGVQRDLLPLIEGATVATKHGTVKTDHILFIASGAFPTSPSRQTCCQSFRGACPSALS